MRLRGSEGLGIVVRRIWPLIVALMLAACSAADTDALGSETADLSDRLPATTPAGLPQATTADFIDAYESGFQRGIADVQGELERGMAGEDSIEAGFAQRWASLSGIRAPGVDAYVRSGEVDAWLEMRYRELGIVRRDVAAANALLFLASWEAFTGMSANRAQSDGARRQIEAFLAKSGTRESSSEVETRRRVYELMAATLARESQRVRMQGDAAGVAAFKRAVQSDFQRLSNNDLERFALTEDGFQER